MSSEPGLGELIEDRGDIPALRDQLKTLAAQRRDQGEDVTGDDMLAMSTKNDPLYVQPAALEKAERFADTVTWARILGPVHKNRIQGRKNAAPTPTAFHDLDNPTTRTSAAGARD